MSTALAERIRQEIGRDGPITFARFMELALYEPELGYYRQPADRPTDSGDFLTAPEAHPVFGWTLASQVEEMWAALGRPERFDLVEYGAGSGTLALGLLDGLRRHGSPLEGSLRYRPVESNPHRMADLAARFETAGLADRLAPRHGEAASGSATGVVLANEFLDALPVHRVTVREGALCEQFVAWEDRFAEHVGPPSTPALADRLASEHVALVEGQTAEVCLEIEPWLGEVVDAVDRGYLIVIDYGYRAPELYGRRRFAGTLLGYRGHRVVDDPFRDVGEQDLTAHVDFTAVEAAATARGFAPLGLVTQAEFLAAAGLAEELRALQQSGSTTFPEYLRARSAVGRMLDPRALGSFKVFVAAKNAPAVALSGLSSPGLPLPE